MSCIWLEITEEMIRNSGLPRKSLFRNVKRSCLVGVDFRFTPNPTRQAHNKTQLWMTERAYAQLQHATAHFHKFHSAGQHFLYILHNPAFLYHGPNVYKVGYSKNPTDRAKKGNMSMLLEDSIIVHEIQVAARCAEAMLFKVMAEYRMRKDREFFNCPIEKIKEFMEIVRQRVEKADDLV